MAKLTQKQKQRLWGIIESIEPTLKVGCPSEAKRDGLKDSHQCERWNDAGACDTECWPQAVIDCLEGEEQPNES